MSKLRKIIFAGLLLSASIVLSRFLAVRTPIVSISFSFIPIILSAMFLGTGWSILVAGLCDFIGALLFPVGAYFPGYTFSAILTGLIYGLFLSKAKKLNGKQFFWRIIVACLLVSVICSLLLNTLWLWVTTKKAVAILAPTRLIKEAILVPFRIVVMQGLHLIFLKSNTYKRLTKNSIIYENEEEVNIEQSEEKTTEEKNAEKPSDDLQISINNEEKAQDSKPEEKSSESSQEPKPEEETKTVQKNSDVKAKKRTKSKQVKNHNTQN